LYLAEAREPSGAPWQQAEFLGMGDGLGAVADSQPLGFNRFQKSVSPAQSGIIVGKLFS
jgi:hypothetical protein